METIGILMEYIKTSMEFMEYAWNMLEHIIMEYVGISMEHVGQ